MSFDAREKSVHAASPVELYEFRRGAFTWRFTSSQQDRVVGQVRYQAVPITRGPIERSGEMGRSSLRVRMARDIEFAAGFVATPPSEVTTLTLLRLHEGDTETAVIWLGRVLNAEWRGIEVEFNCEPVYTSLKRTGLRRLYQRHCPHALYGAGCNVAALAFRVAGTVAAVEGLRVTVPAAAGFGSGYFTGGYATWAGAGVLEKRMITGHSLDVVTLAAVPPGLSVGQAIDLYPGCDHTLATCHGKFANSAHYGGFPFMPVKNPFGSSIY